MISEVLELRRRLCSAYREIEELEKELEDVRAETSRYMIMYGGLQARMLIEKKARCAISRN